MITIPSQIKESVLNMSGTLSAMSYGYIPLRSGDKLSGLTNSVAIIPNTNPPIPTPDIIKPVTNPLRFG